MDPVSAPIGGVLNLFAPSTDTQVYLTLRDIVQVGAQRGTVVGGNAGNWTKVVLGRNIEGSPLTYQAIAETKGATYFQLAAWDDYKTVVGPDMMREINKAFLDQQMALGKEFFFTADPALAGANTFTGLEYQHLISLG